MESKLENIIELYQERARLAPDSIVAWRKNEFGVNQEIAIEEFLKQVMQVGLGLLAAGVTKGKCVGILGSTSYEWVLLDLAIMSIGAVTVGIYESDSAEQVAHIVADTKMELMFTETLAQTRQVQSLGVNGLEVYCLADGALRKLLLLSKTSTFDYEGALAQVKRDDLATIIYTSGTTAKPKGVELKHRHFIDTCVNVHQILPEICFNPRSRVVMFLPLAHVLARLVVHALGSSRVVLSYCGDTRSLLTEIEAFAPTALLVVPRVLEKVYNSVLQKARTPLKKRIISWGIRQAKLRSEANYLKVDPKDKTLSFRIADLLVLSKVKKALGGSIEYLVSGGAPLAADLCHFYRGMGIYLLQGYGLSETTGPISVETTDDYPFDKLGRVLGENQIKIEEATGEILLKGPSVFTNYHNLPKETASAFTTQGWFRTGDVGKVDPKGYISITGRLKDVIVTAGGKNVSPQVLEEQLATHPLIGTVIVVGDQKPYISCLISLDEEMLTPWLLTRGEKPHDVIEATKLPLVNQSLKRAINRANSKVSRAESIRKYTIINQKFTVENGYLTASMKPKRDKIVEDFSKIIEQMYEE